jgi:RNA polymerase sigma factor (sigma-70 family)
MSEKEEIHNPRAFLFTTTRRLIIDWYRKKKSVSLEGLMYSNEESTEYDLVDEKSIDSLSLGAEGRFLLDKIQELELTARQPVYLRFVEGLSPQEIGDILGVSANAASVRINRGLKELRKKTGYDNE